jgi:hypothetical protein
VENRSVGAAEKNTRGTGEDAEPVCHPSRLGFSAANERRVLVIHLMANVFGRRFFGGEFHFANERAAPGLVDTRTELALHFIELFSPGFAFRGDFEAAAFAANGTRARGERVANDARPSSGEPRERGFRAFETPHDTTEKISRSFHGGGILSHATPHEVQQARARDSRSLPSGQHEGLFLFRAGCR